ncbi:MAG: ATP-binding protein [Pelomonas sp.]|nr:ATP-binding protein [Roseateles sp.]
MRLNVTNFAQIANVDLDFGGKGDLTILIGQQATGKSLALQWLKLLTDTDSIRSDWDRFGTNWKGQDARRPLDLFFGEGLAMGWRDGKSQVALDGRVREFKRLFYRNGGRQGPAQSAVEKTYFIPAHRALLMSDGWPRFFQQHAPGTPYVARSYSERLARWLGDSGASVFPVANRLQGDLRRKLDETIFHRATLNIDKSSTQSRLILSAGKSHIPYMAWTAGQREFVPLLVALYELLPAGKVSTLDKIETVIVEEPELGLHPRGLYVMGLAILALLQRGYRVVVSTHSPLLADFAWAINRLRVAAQEGKAKDSTVLKAFGLGASVANKKIAEAVLDCRARTFHLGYGSDGLVRSKDISMLSSISDDETESSFGGLLKHSIDLAEAVSALDFDEAILTKDLQP